MIAHWVKSLSWWGHTISWVIWVMRRMIRSLKDNCKTAFVDVKRRSMWVALSVRKCPHFLVSRVKLWERPLVSVDGKRENLIKRFLLAPMSREPRRCKFKRQLTVSLGRSSLKGQPSRHRNWIQKIWRRSFHWVLWLEYYTTGFC